MTTGPPPSAERTLTAPGSPGEGTPAPARRRRRWPRRLLLGTLATLLVLLVTVAAVALWSVRRPFPQDGGTLTLPLLDGPVEVHRDDLGVPTIVGSTERDLHRALGFVHAQDRFWQMDTWRHIGRGRTAELFGASQLPTDRFIRTLGWERVAEAEYRLLGPEARQVLHDYADGVNAYAGSRPHRALGLEYSVLGLLNPAYRPPPWQPVDSLVFMKLMAWDLQGNMSQEIDRAVLLERLGGEQLADLYPPYDGAPVTLGDFGPFGDPYERADRAAARPLLERVADAAATVPALSPPGDGVGSNNWVVGGQHTVSGAPLLANDPHLGIQMPSIWHQSALRCAPDARDCDLDVAGFTFPSIPGIVVGHNGTIAWGVTNLGADVADLFVERLHPDDPTRYEVEGEWVEMEVTTETLRSSDGTLEELEVRSTRNGPVISGRFDPLDGVDPATVTPLSGGEPYAITLRWTALEPRPMFESLPALNRARDWDGFRAALASFFVPGQNFVYADVDGNIGYQATGAVPVRARGTGELPVPGWVDDYQWVGEVPFDDMPREYNPERGWIATANNPPVGDAYPFLLGTDWDRGQRQARIVELLDGGTRPFSVDDVGRQQVDDQHHAAGWLLPALAAADPGGAGDPAATERAREAVRILEAWDGNMDAGSAGAAVFAATWRNLLAHMFGGRLPETRRPDGGTRWFEVVRRQMDDPGAHWWDDPRTAATETRDEALAMAASAAIAELRERLGDDPQRWAWGDLHTATFRNATLGESGIGLVEGRFNRGPYPVGGSTSVVNATGWHDPDGYQVTWLPSFRMVLDLGDLDRSRAIHTTGQSGHAYHRNYTSMVEPWSAGELRPLRWDLAGAVADADATLRLRP